MKTFKISIVVFFLTISFTSIAQLNPIKNLYWNHWYSMPDNFFELKWSPPDSSTTDTLVGYNVYRGSILYRFQTDSSLHHIDTWDTNSGEDFVYNNSMWPFYIHITAVYNSNKTESAYNDSALVIGAYVGIDDLKNEKVINFPNPMNANSVIHLNFPERKIEYISIVNSSGQVITKIVINSNEAFIKVSDLHLKNDLYFLMVHGNNYCITKKFIKTE